jgi:hypothetical protein
MRKILFLIAILAGSAASAAAQGFPYDIFKPRPLKEVTATTTKSVRPDDSGFFATTLLESKMLVTFTGQSRPMLPARKQFLSNWAGLFNHPKEYAARYETEYLYKEGDDEYWLGTQTPVTKYFPKELKPGDKITLYVISIGGYRTKEGFDCVILVEEFQK